MPVLHRHAHETRTAGARGSLTEGALLAEEALSRSRRDELILVAAIGADVAAGAAAAGIAGSITHKTLWTCIAGVGAFVLALAVEVSTAAIWAYHAASS